MNLYSIFFLLLFNVFCFSQNKNSQEVQLFFYDECSGEMIFPDYEILSKPEHNYDYITVSTNVGKWKTQYVTVIKSYKNTIRIPKILFAVDSNLNSNNWTYLNCDKICEGFETDFYDNGNIRIEGIFKNGKPIEIKEYRENGILNIQTFYDNFTLDAKRINYFDEKGELVKFEKRKNKRSKTITRTFDKNQNQISKEIANKYPFGN